MEPLMLPNTDNSRSVVPLPDETVVPFVLVVVLVDQEAQTELTALLARLSPAITPVAYIIVSASAGVEATAQATAGLPPSPLPCHVVQDGDLLRPDTVYIVPPQSSARVHNGNILLKPLGSGSDTIHETNLLLSSIASKQNFTAITVSLGRGNPVAFAATDRIREAGGFALRALTAARDHDPDALASTDVYDLVLPADTLPAELLRLIDGIHPHQSGRIPQTSYATVQPILTLLRTHLGYDLQGYRLEDISRRIQRRMLLRRKDISTYYALLQSSSTELQQLGSDILMPFTRFFRDADSWARLSEVGLPQLFKRGTERPTRIWSAGCSTGEEAYSLAMLLLEHQARTGQPMPFVIFATDIDTRSLLAARAGLYSHTIEQELSPERLERFFRREDAGYRVLPELRDLCVFSNHNLCFEAPLADIDLLLCRHTLQYFGGTLQEQAFANLVHALSPQGICMLGEASVPANLDNRLMPLDIDHQLYSKSSPTMDKIRPHEQQIPPAPIAQALPAVPAWGALNMLEGPIALQRYADNLVSARFGPPGMIVDSDFTVLEIRGELTPFVQISAGLASRKLQQLVKPAISEKVIELVRAASSGSIPMVAHCVLSPSTDSVRVEVLPLPTESFRNHFFLVLLQFETRSRKTAGQGVSAASTSRSAGRAGIDANGTSVSDIGSREGVQRQRSDAEDGSTADSPEAVFGANQHEPLPHFSGPVGVPKAPQGDTGTQQVFRESGNSDAQVNSLLAEIGIPLVLLNRQLEILLLSPPAADILGLAPEDVGKVLTSLESHFNDFGLAEPLLLEVLQTLRTHEQEVQDRRQHWYRIVIRPHQVANETVGLILMFVDIDTERTLRHQLLEARDFAACVLQQIPLPLAVLHEDLTFRSTNAAFQSLTGTADQKLAGWPLQDFTQRFWGVSSDTIELHKLGTLPIGGLIETEFSTRSAPGQILLVKGQALLNGGARVLLLVVEDVTLRRETDRVLARQQTALADQLENRDTLLKVTQKELHDLAQHLFTVQEQERERIASELHDDVSQRLSLLQMACNRLSQGQHGPAETLEIESILQQVQSLSSDVRVMSHNLHPALLKQLGLVVALKSLIDDFREKENLPATLTSTVGALHPSDLASTTCYRVVQEALRNVAKHAGRTHVKVSLDVVGDRLRLQIRDFGNGFDQSSYFPQPGLGLTSMRERTRIAGGNFSIVSTLGEGTVVVVDVPAGVDV